MIHQWQSAIAQHDRVGNLGDLPVQCMENSTQKSTGQWRGPESGNLTNASRATKGSPEGSRKKGQLVCSKMQQPA